MEISYPATKKTSQIIISHPKIQIITPCKIALLSHPEARINKHNKLATAKFSLFKTQTLIKIITQIITQIITHSSHPNIFLIAMSFSINENIINLNHEKN